MAKLCDADVKMAEKMYMELSSKERLAHFWEYHKSKVFAIIFMIMFIVVIMVLRPTPQPEADFSIKFVNTYMPGLTEAGNYIETDYEKYLGADSEYRIAFSHTQIRSDDATKTGIDMERLMIELVAGELELFIYDDYAKEKLCTADWVYDLSTCLDSEVLERVDKRLIYHEYPDGQKVPVAIDISGTEYVKNAGIQGDKVYISFAAKSDDKENAKQFVTYILSEQL